MLLMSRILDSLKEDGTILVNEALEKVYREWLKEHPFDVGEGWAMEPGNQEEMPVDEELAVQAAGRIGCSDRGHPGVLPGKIRITVRRREVIC